MTLGLHKQLQTSVNMKRSLLFLITILIAVSTFAHPQPHARAIQQPPRRGNRRRRQAPQRTARKLAEPARVGGRGARSRRRLSGSRHPQTRIRQGHQGTHANQSLQQAAGR